MCATNNKSIREFFAGQNIFLTGGTGFLGKLFIEKILRCCPDIGEIFVLIRPKGKMSVDDRLEHMLSLALYDKLRDERPFSLKKIIPISGDVSKKELGLSSADKQMLIERVSIVIHCSANVKFNDFLTTAIFTNTRSTRDICILAEKMKNLVALIYVSTMYTQTTHPNLKEITYPPITDWKKSIEIAESLDTHILNILTAKYLGKMPNTYVFTKNLAEDVIKSYSKSIPCAIFRPTIVTSTVSDPFPGWIDNLYGPIGLGTGIGRGFIHILYIDSDTYMNCIPADHVIKAMIQATWKRGLETFIPNSEPQVFNTSAVVKLTWKDNIANLLDSVKVIAADRNFWAVSIYMTKSFTIYYILNMLWHIIPAVFVDQVLKYCGYKPILLKLQRTCYMAMCALKYFAFYNWQFDNTNIIKLNESLLPEDEEAFKIEWYYNPFNYTCTSAKGVKKFILNENISEEGLEAARKQSQRMTLYVRILRYFIILGVLWIIYKWKLSGISFRSPTFLSL